MNITHQQVAILQSLCLVCPKTTYHPGCPFRSLRAVSHDAREAMFSTMSLDHVAELFALVQCDCPQNFTRQSLGAA